MMGAQDRFGYEKKIQYLDLYAGPGQYDDGTESTPILVLKQAIANPKLCERLFAIFNDANIDFVNTLRLGIDRIPGIDLLHYKPVVNCSAVDDDLVQKIVANSTVPTFFFADPFGYKGISLALLNSALKEFGSDCVFFFNSNRVNSALQNQKVENRMNDLFGKQNADRLREMLRDLQPHERELAIVEEFCNAIRGAMSSTLIANGKLYILPFRFRHEVSDMTSHYLIFISKHVRGYEIMKDIMARESSSHEQGVASFEYNQATIRQPFLLGLNRPVDDLAKMLIEAFAGREIRMVQIYEEHNVDTPFIKKNYKDALAQLETENLIRVDPPAQKRPKRNGIVSFKDEAIVTFLVKNNS